MRHFIGLITGIIFLLPAAGQDRLVSPAEFLGYDLGDRFTPHHRVVDYFTHVAAHSPNVRLEHYGTTYEGRPLLAAFVTSPENLGNLNALQAQNLGAIDGSSDPGTKAFVWLSYNVHGNEAVSTEAAMKTLYDLADPGNGRTQAWLEDTVVIVDPCLNPDGRERYVIWYNRTIGLRFNADTNAREHHEPWPGGRTNHYYFDLNRDWAWATQKETQQRLDLYGRWMPQVHVDFHEQGVDEPYYFAPAAEPFHEDISAWQRSFQTTIGRNHMRYFDQNGWLYFTRQVFDLYYPGYGDTWPIFNGAVGMTYEQGGSGRAGLGIVSATGDTLTLRDRIAHHYTTGLSTVEASARDHTRLVSEFRDYFERARTNPPGSYRACLIKGSNEPDRLRALADHLHREGIAYGYSDHARSTRGFDYAGGTSGRVEVAPGDLVVSAYQPKSVLTKVLFEPRGVLADSLTYDVTAWALPYVYGVEAYALTERLDPDVSERPASNPPVLDVEHPYAYLLEWESPTDAAFLSDVLRAGILVRFAGKPFETGGRAYAPGTLIITRRDNKNAGDRFDQIVREAAGAQTPPCRLLGIRHKGPRLWLGRCVFPQKTTRSHVDWGARVVRGRR